MSLPLQLIIEKEMYDWTVKLVNVETDEFSTLTRVESLDEAIDYADDYELDHELSYGRIIKDM